MQDEFNKGISLFKTMNLEKRKEGINHLLLISIDNYENASKLNNCVKDARQFREVLVDRYRFENENITNLENEAATRDNILSSLHRFSSTIRPEDNLVIWFSGHGEVFGDIGYWIPFEAEIGKRSQYVSTYDLKVELDRVDCFHLLLIVDSCFSGTLFNKLRSNMTGAENRKSRSGLSASHSKELAYDGRVGENSPFAKHLLKNLIENNADIGINKLSALVIDDVRRETEGRQTPVFESLDIKGHDLGQFVLRLKGQNTFVDSRDGKVYPTIEVNGKIWMAQNLNYNISGSLTYGDVPEISKIFGRLYPWEMTSKACPDGWGIPNGDDWFDLLQIFGGPLGKLKRSDGSFLEYGFNGSNAYDALIKDGESKFNAELGGFYYNYSKSFKDLGVDIGRVRNI